MDHKKVNCIFFFIVENLKIKDLFKCRNESKNILTDKVCDGKVHCLYNSDEMNCGTPNKKQQKILERKCQILFKNELKCSFYKNFDKRFLNIHMFQNFQLIELNGNGNTSFFNRSLNLPNYNLKHLKISNFLNSSKILNIMNKSSNLVSLTLKNNKLEFLGTFIALKNLQFLDLSNNLIKVTEFLKDFRCVYLNYLDLSDNPLVYIKNLNFAFLKILKLNKLKFLIIENTKRYMFTGNIEKLFLAKSSLSLNMTISFLNSLQSIKLFYGDYLHYCCLLWKFHNEFVECRPKSALFFSCSPLLQNNYGRIAFWTYGVWGIFFNIISFIVSIIFEKSNIKFYRISINVSDFLIGFFVLSLAIVDLYFGENFIENFENWKNSHFCLSLNVIISFSILNSLLIQLALTVERFIAILYPFSVLELQRRHLIIIAFINLFSLFLAISPFLIIQVKNFFKINFS